MNNISARSNAKQKQSLGKRIWRYRYMYLMLLPALTAMIIFHYVPLYGIQIAFKKFNAVAGIWGSKWIGLKNFQRMFNENTFLNVLRNTLWISGLKLFISFPCGVIFALLLNEIGNLRLKKVFQTVSYLPHFISWVVIAGIMRSVLSLNGPINQLIELFGGEKVYFLTKSSYFVPILIVSDIWKGMGWGSIVYLAAIAGIPVELYESAKIDGASRLQCMFYITLPSIMYVVAIMFVLRTGNVLNAGFDQIFNLYSPIVYDVADIIDTYVYRVGLINIDFSYSTAIGLFKNVVGFTLLLVVNRVSRNKLQYGV